MGLRRTRLAAIAFGTVFVTALSGSPPPSLPAQQAPPAGQQQPPPTSQPPAGQQQPPPTSQPPAGQQQPPPVFRAGVRLVRVDVTVLGSGDRPVDDLKAADFEVTEDGVPQTIETFQFTRLDGQPSASHETSLEIRSQEHAEAEAARDDVRLFVIFLDDYHINKLPNITIPLRRDLTAFVNRMQPTDLVAVVDPLTPASAMRFTRTQADVLDVIRTFEGRLGELFPIRGAAEEAQLRSGDVARLRAQVTLSALNSIALRLGGLRDGRKTIIFVSQGPPLMFGSGDVELDLREVIASANRANVTIHVLDPRGLSPGGTFAMDSLYRLAGETGGRTIINTNSFDAGLRRVVEDASAYYLIGYTPRRTEDDGKYHRIGVRVRRPGTRAVARLGYFAPSRKEIDAAAAIANRPEVPGVSAAMKTFARLEQRGAVPAWVGVSRGADGRTVATVTWEPPATPQPRSVRSVDVEVVPAGGHVAVGPARTLSAPGDKTGARPRDSFVIAPGDVMLRFTAHAADGAVVDRWEQPVSVPDWSAAPIALATPRVHVASSLSELRELQAAADPVPRALRVFRQTDRVFVDVECATADPGASPTIAAHLLSAEGQELVALPVPPLERGRIRVELPVRGFGKGTYLLRIRARLGEASAEQVVTFRVTP